MNEWEQQQPVEPLETSPTDPDISFKHIGLLAGIIFVPLIIIGVVLPFIPKTKTPQIRIADSGLVLPSPTSETSLNTVAVAVLASVTGDVQIKKGEIWGKAVPEDEIAQSDIIKTSFGSQATLLFGSGSIIRVDQNSQIALSEYSRDGESWIIKINQIFGRSWNRVQKLVGASVYEVNTPTAVATVRGTAFGIDADASGSAITVDEGTVTAKVVDTKTPERRVIQEVKIEKQQTVEITPKRVEEVKRAIEERKPTAEIITARRVEKLPEWVEEHKREVEREAPRIQEIKREIERKVEMRINSLSNPLPSFAPTRIINGDESRPTPSPTIFVNPYINPNTNPNLNTSIDSSTDSNFEKPILQPTPVSATGGTETNLSPTPITTSGTTTTDLNSTR